MVTRRFFDWECGNYAELEEVVFTPYKGGKQVPAIRLKMYDHPIAFECPGRELYFAAVYQTEKDALREMYSRGVWKEAKEERG